jgi:N-acetyl-gamma-glutamylphosphate reductase
VTGTGRGGASDFGYVETSEDFFAYGLQAHPHVPEMEQALTLLPDARQRSRSRRTWFRWSRA